MTDPKELPAILPPGLVRPRQSGACNDIAARARLPGAVRLQTVQRCNGAGGDTYPWLAGGTAASGVWIQLAGTVDRSACTTVENLILFVGADAGDLLTDDVVMTALPQSSGRARCEVR